MARYTDLAVRQSSRPYTEGHLLIEKVHNDRARLLLKMTTGEFVFPKYDLEQSDGTSTSLELQHPVFTWHEKHKAAKS